MLTELAIVPSAPLLVPQLSGPDTVEAGQVRAAVRQAGVSLSGAAKRWVVIGVDGPARRLQAYGVDVPVSASPADDDLAAPLSILVACWIRGDAAPEVSVTPLTVDEAIGVDAAVAAGRELATTIAADPEPVGVLVVADGATALTASAPGGGDRDSAHRLQASIDRAVAVADVAALTGLDAAACAADGVGGRVPLQVLAGLVDGMDVEVNVRYTGAPFGVGYTVATWRPTGKRR